MTEELVPTDASAPAVTESGRTIHEHSEKDVTDALNFLVLTASPRRAANLMRDLGHPVSERAAEELARSLLPHPLLQHPPGARPGDRRGACREGV
jgi:protein required for attachment to host cells